MAGIGSYEKGKAFALKSGNKPSFKSVGSSPAKHPHTDKVVHGSRGHNTDSGKSVAEGGKANPGNPNYVPPKEESPAKTTHKAENKRKEELLNQGFTQEDADQMIKSGAVTGKTKDKVIQHEVKHSKVEHLTPSRPAYIKTLQNKKAKGGKLTKAERRQLDEYRIHVTEQNK